MSFFLFVLFGVLFELPVPVTNKIFDVDRGMGFPRELTFLAPMGLAICDGSFGRTGPLPLSTISKKGDDDVSLVNFVFVYYLFCP
jgi:hypothetical protein